MFVENFKRERYLILRNTLCQSGGMADAADSKSVARKGVWVQVPPLVFNFFYSFLQMSQSVNGNSDTEV